MKWTITQLAALSSLLVLTCGSTGAQAAGRGHSARPKHCAAPGKSFHKKGRKMKPQPKPDPAPIPSGGNG